MGREHIAHVSDRASNHYVQHFRISKFAIKLRMTMDQKYMGRIASQ
jgi:hypothetical protein